MSGAEASEALDADPEAVARAICLRQLTAAPRTRGQLATVLARRNVPEPVADRVLDRLVEVGLVDDRAFAEAWVQSRHAGRGLARRALHEELTTRGVDRELAAAAVEALDPAAESAAARRLAEQALRRSRGRDTATRVRRAAGMLARRGYSPALAMTAVREALAAEGSQDPGADALTLP